MHLLTFPLKKKEKKEKEVLCCCPCFIDMITSATNPIDPKNEGITPMQISRPITVPINENKNLMNTLYRKLVTQVVK